MMETSIPQVPFGVKAPVKPFILIGLVLALFFSAQQSLAQSSDDLKGWVVRGWGGAAGRYVINDNDTFDDPVFGTVQTSVDGSSFALGGDLEYLFNKWLGADFGLAYTNTNLVFQHSVGEDVQNDNLGVMPLFAAVNFHVINNDAVDIWAGYQLAYVLFLGDVRFDVPNLGAYEIPTSNTFSYKGFNVGTDLKFSECWGVNVAFRWNDADASDEILVDPAFFTVGVRYKF